WFFSREARRRRSAGTGGLRPRVVRAARLGVDDRHAAVGGGPLVGRVDDAGRRLLVAAACGVGGGPGGPGGGPGGGGGAAGGRCREEAWTTRGRAAVSWVDFATWISGRPSPEATYWRYGFGKTATW